MIASTHNNHQPLEAYLETLISKTDEVVSQDPALLFRALHQLICIGIKGVDRFYLNLLRAVNKGAPGNLAILLNSLKQTEPVSVDGLLVDLFERIRVSPDTLSRFELVGTAPGTAAVYSFALSQLIADHSLEICRQFFETQLCDKASKFPPGVLLDAMTCCFRKYRLVQCSFSSRKSSQAFISTEEALSIVRAMLKELQHDV